MGLPIINSIASWILKKRIHQIELFMKYPNEVQEELLHNLLQIAENTTIGKKYGFESIKSYTTFSQRVPVSTYEDLEPLIEQTRTGEQNVFWPTSIKWFAKSSGTTNAKSKFIPVSPEALEDCHYAGSKDLLCLYLNNNEDSQLFTGKSLRLGGSKQLYEDNNTFFGDLSAILIDNMPFWANPLKKGNNNRTVSSLNLDIFFQICTQISENKIKFQFQFAKTISNYLLKIPKSTFTEKIFEYKATLWSPMSVNA